MMPITPMVCAAFAIVRLHRRARLTEINRGHQQIQPVLALHINKWTGFANVRSCRVGPLRKRIAVGRASSRS